MKKFSTVIVLITVILLFPVPVAANQTDCLAGDFIDIEDHWAYDQISELIAMGIVKGYTETVYDKGLGKYIQVRVTRPYHKITRAEFATILYQALNLNPHNGAAPFNDEIPSWATEAVNTLFAAGIIKGNPDGSFRAYKNITRAEIATMLVQALNDKSPQAGRYFPDVPSWHWAYNNIQKASAIGIINGLPNGKFTPGQSAKRAEVMVMLYQFLLNDKSQAPDHDELLSYTDEMLKKMEANINGSGSVNLISIASYLTGEQAAILGDSEKALNELKQNGNVNYRVSYPGTVVNKSDRWAEVVYDTIAVFKTKDANLEHRSKEHYYLMKIRDRWYIYSNTDERLL